MEEKLLKSFFFPFLVGVILSSFILIIFVFLLTNSNIDKRTTQSLIDLEIQISKINLKKVNLILDSILLKIQTSLNEQILFYQRMAGKIKDSDIDKIKYHEDKLRCVYDFDQNFFNKNQKYLEYMGSWYIKNDTKKFEDIDNNDTKKQIISFNYLMQNLYSAYSSSSKSYSNLVYFFFFEETNLYISYPILYDYTNDFLDIFYKFENNPYWCVNDKGELYNIYNFKCRDFYVDIQKARSDIYDNNFFRYKNRSIFITNSYKQINNENILNIFTICIRFLDPISINNAYACSDVNLKDLDFAFDNINSDIKGYFFISSVGFNKVFFFPQENDYPKIITENIYKWSYKYLLEEKTYFFNHIQKLLTSNYNDQLVGSLYNEVYVNNNNSYGQHFFINNKKLRYSILPVFLNNLSGEKEHILSIIYIYNSSLYSSEITVFDSSLKIRIICEMIFFLFIGLSLLYIIILSLNILAKYITIPIKNANYMLKGINIGGNNRLYYLKYLKKRQDDNLENLEKMYLLDFKRNDKDKNISMDEISDNILLRDNESDNISSITKNNINFDDRDTEMINNNNNDYNKIYDEESSYIEKEYNFYDFDDSLLQYRPYEIDKLVNKLLDIKKVLNLTSSDQNLERIIDYSYSENIFKNYKNIKGSSLSQSNIGNLQIRLLKYDKAIYHLALSLQDDKIQKFLKQNLSDEFDGNNSLINKIHNSFITKKIKEKNNILIKKQQNNKNNTISQKIIGILIHTRYCRLIYAYFKFFKVMKKLKNSKSQDINGQFMNTNFHSINYYHKIIIQYIYLCFLKNDLIKIGESILDYIEFLINFKFKTSKEKKHILKIRYKDISTYKEKQNHKKKIFDKIINLFNLFDDYITYVKDNTTLNDYKNIIKDFSNDLYNNEFNYLGNNSFVSFRINIQRYDFLKGKFSLICKNYDDALFYFIRSAKKNSIALDGLIKKRSLKHIFKLLIKMEKKFKKYGLNNLSSKNHFIKLPNKKRKSLSNIDNNNIKENISFDNVLKVIKDDIIQDINEFNYKKAKDIVILIDFNVYFKTDNSDDKIQSFILNTKTIINNYLSSNDRLSVFIYKKQYYIICPLLYKKQIDMNNFSKDLINYKSKAFNEKGDDEYDINLDNFEQKDFSEISIEEESLEDNNDNNKNELIYNNIEGLIKTINYIQNYLEMKKEITNEKYIILFTDLFNSDIFENVNNKINLKNYFDKLKNNKEIIFLLVGKIKTINNENDEFSKENAEDIFNFICNKFGEKSEIIYLQNIAKIKGILFNNNFIRDEIIFPNEIYK